MPFGPFQDFQDCVDSNGDKQNPEAYCAYLHKQITGEWPGALKHSLPQSAWDVYIDRYCTELTAKKTEGEAHKSGLLALEQAGWQKAQFGWFRSYQAPKTRAVKGATIFAAGAWTDSGGNTRKWAPSDLEAMVAAFEAHAPPVVPLKAGHTSDSFNRAVAEKLGVPVELVIGDRGSGQIALGKVSKLRKEGNILFADFESVPEVIADLIEGGQYSTISVEIEDKVGNYGPAITAVAMLGAEEPAVSVAGFDKALVFGGKRNGAAVWTFQAGLKEAELAGNVDALIKWVGDVGFDNCVKSLTGKEGIADPVKVCGWLKGQAHQKKGEHVSETKTKFAMTDEEMTALCAELGLDPATATAADVLAKVKDLKGKAVAQAPPPEIATMKAEFAKVSSQVAEYAKQIADYQHKERLAKYQSATTKLTAIPGKPDELAAKLADLEEKTSVSLAEEVLAQYQAADKVAQAATKAIGTARTNLNSGSVRTTHEFAKKAQALAEEKKISFQKALSLLAQSDPKGFYGYNAAVREEGQ